MRAEWSRKMLKRKWLLQQKKGQRQKYIFMKTRLCPRVFLIHNWIRVSRVKTENGRGCDDILYNPDDMGKKRVFFSTSCLAYSSIKRTYRPGKEAHASPPSFCGRGGESKSFFILLIIHNIWWCLVAVHISIRHGNTENFELDYDEKIIKLFWHSCEKKSPQSFWQCLICEPTGEKNDFQQTQKWEIFLPQSNQFSGNFH